ncbi:hypothetical protein B566_EDAN005434 [Ephemera danica]|nr:hypothetical protein B566_EDAN005434 [Ephemera danica]
MEEELRCPTCKQFYSNPVLLPCYHALCLACAVNSQQQSTNNPHAVAGPSTTQNHHHAGAASTSSSSSDTASETAPGEQDCPDIDKLSILSETDSGVVCNSRPNSYVGTPNNMQGILLFPPLQSISALSLTCPVCHKVVYFDENGAHNLPRYRAMSNIVEKYTEGRRLQQQFTQRVPCQLCAEDPPRQAIVRCEQCDVWYCEPCREGCHPARGPLAKHTLIDVRGPPTKGPGGSPASHRPSPPPSEISKCTEHPDESLNLYCMLCKLAACPQCVLQDSRHTSHDVQAISAMCKAQKLLQMKKEENNKQLANTKLYAKSECDAKGLCVSAPHRLL